MLNYNIYDDIAARTGGDIYIGVVGPVRTGKSTFIKKFMELLVLDKITDENKLKRMLDELPQSADGKTIMTTEPKFVPNEAASVVFEKTSANIRLIDCVGYMIPDALGHSEGEKPRLVRTPWSDEEMPFQQAAEIGTKKVICDHSTVGILVTTDGSITDIGRSKYVESEERVVNELRSCGKPFVIVLNSKNPQTTDTVRLKESLQERYGVPVVLCDVNKLDKEGISDIVSKILYEFPIAKLQLKLPAWMQSLSFEDKIIKQTVADFAEKTKSCKKMRDCEKLKSIFANSPFFEEKCDVNFYLSDGVAEISCKAKDGLYYQVVTEVCGQDLSDEYKLLCFVKKLSQSYREYEGIRQAMVGVKSCGYGIINPTVEDMELQEPEIVKKGNQYGIKLKAGAPSYHIVKVDVNTEISPTIGSEQQSEDLLKKLLDKFENDKKEIWNTDMFGISLNTLVKEDLTCKLGNMPEDTQKKIRKTVTRIVNEGKGGVLCILL